MAMFECGCCGEGFSSTREEQRKHDQDKGYGICPGCVKSSAMREERRWDSLRDKVADALGDANRVTFLAMDVPLQRGIMLEMMDDGLITWGLAVAQHRMGGA